MSFLKKGQMRKAWVAAKETAKKKCKTKGEATYLVTFLKEDFGPKLDEVEELLAKFFEFKEKWAEASKTQKVLKKKIDEAGIEEMNIDVQKALLDVLKEIRTALDEVEPK